MVPFVSKLQGKPAAVDQWEWRCAAELDVAGFDPGSISTEAKCKSGHALKFRCTLKNPSWSKLIRNPPIRRAS